ncbi:molybdate ABC transporter substrate-binding protein [Microvirga makkahensis]|uniref:Molybdate ABC transporter substrate-binding protein n=1 Tax=Microvirga makkahensis TaxID=1128670 RepID=A0A7X3MN97_9HYPH|nr:molybdate ABC transporter substrate-binding protein [Microvirga makkahensis]MXQ10179.1 molybdate ABC transporter substrate-binding protein [Microvirga makkahensis]
MRAARSTRGAFTALVIGLALACSGLPAQARDVVVFAAASLKNALDDAAAAWSRESGRKAVISYAGSNVLAKQIEAGAPADVFFSADLDWMKYAISRNLIRPGTRLDLLGNDLVLIAPKGSAVQVSLRPDLDLASVLAGGRLAMGHVDAVPAGKYGKAGLEKLGAWNGIKDRIAQTENVRAALLLVSHGEAPLGIVYKTDAVSEPNVRIVGIFPEGTHPPIVYPVAITQDSMHPDAAPLLEFLRSAKARPFFEKQGFKVLNTADSGS